MNGKPQTYESEKRLWLYRVLMAPPESKGVFHRTRIQKLVFLLQEEVQDGEVAIPEFEFEPGEYGPYSSELASTLDRLTQREFVQEKEQEQPDGSIFYEYDVAPEIEQVAAQDAEEGEVLTQKADEIFSEYGESELTELVFSIMGEYPDFVS